MAVLAEYEVVVVELFYLQADIGERTHAEVAFYGDGVDGFSVDGRTLDEQTVALMLEIAENLSTIGLKPGNTTRETKVTLSVRAPLSPEVAGLSAFLTGNGQ